MMTDTEDDKDLKIKELEFEYKWMSFWMTLAFLSLFVAHFSSSDRTKDLKQKVTQERNVAITFCVENPTACKTEYLKLK
jgi:hypothetical protein